jgi:hypothetical protein
MKEYRRMNNLCLKCDDKYTPIHTCSTPTSNLNVIECAAVDGGEILYDDLLDVIDTPQLLLMNDEAYLSLHAVSGQPQ